LAVNYQLNEEPCPVPDSLLGELYRANPHGLSALVETVPARVRATLAVYCYRRAHLASIGLAIAATCDEDDLVAAGDNGAVLYERSRNPELPVEPTQYAQRRKVTLASGGFMRAVAQDLI
jgi:hypothetical protein